MRGTTAKLHLRRNPGFVGMMWEEGTDAISVVCACYRQGRERPSQRAKEDSAASRGLPRGTCRGAVLRALFGRVFFPSPSLQFPGHRLHWHEN